jgi:hypothetical protein
MLPLSSAWTRHFQFRLKLYIRGVDVGVDFNVQEFLDPLADKRNVGGASHHQSKRDVARRKGVSRQNLSQHIGGAVYRGFNGRFEIRPSDVDNIIQILPVLVFYLDKSKINLG